MRRKQPIKDWYKGIWFSHAIPKYSFLTWLASVSCVFSQEPIETRDHLFFTCGFYAEIWAKLTQMMLGSHYTTHHWCPNRPNASNATSVFNTVRVSDFSLFYLAGEERKKTWRFTYFSSSNCPHD